MLARSVSQCLLSLSIYTCYPVTQINLVNKYAASKVSLLYLMVFFCLSVTHSLANSFANAFFEYNVRRWRQAEIAFPKFSDHFPPAIRIYLGRMLGGDRNDACRRRAYVRLTTERKNKHCLLGPRTHRSRNKKTRRARFCACGWAASERLALEEKPLVGCARGAFECAPPVGSGMEYYSLPRVGISPVPKKECIYSFIITQTVLIWQNLYKKLAMIIIQIDIIIRLTMKYIFILYLFSLVNAQTFPLQI